jgi:1-acyl-sn-glycerol-3-phosphate acyltransferase
MRQFLRNLIMWALHVGFVRPVLNWVVGVRYRRKNRVPDGPCLVVSNHNSHLDAAVLMTLFPLRRIPRVRPIAAADYFGKTWFMRGLAMLMMNGLPIERQPKPGKDPLAPLVQALNAGESLIFFPEGSRGKAGVVAPFRSGIGRLVRKMPGLLIVPVYLAGPERIWPRGELVPVPLNIDAVVGQPRTYSIDLQPREIAEKVREDVLSLAPPPPPQPVPAPAPAIRVAVCGLDAQHRERIFDGVVRRLARDGLTLGIADPMVEADSDGVREINRPIPFAPGRAWMGLLARIFRTSGLFKGERFVKMVEQAQLSEALGQGAAARFVVSDGSALVDLLAWADADFYRGVFDESGMNHLMQYLAGEKRIPGGAWWRFARKAPEVWLVNVFDLARPPVPDVLVLTPLPVSRILQRLRSRGQRIQAYQNEELLERLQRAYSDVGGILARRRKVEVIELDPETMTEDDLAERVADACSRPTNDPATASPQG